MTADDLSGAEASTTETAAMAPPYVIGIGSSAGGLEAIRELVRNLPEKANAAYVVVQHMSPDHRSLLTTLIGRETRLPVEDVTNGTEPQPDVIYVTPPNRDVLLRDGKLTLIPPSMEPAAPKPSVDRFLISASEDIGERAMAIILSGTGSDGAYGVQAIREAGGIAIAQDFSTAKYDGMPVSAVETGCIDLVLSPIQIGAHLGKILSQPRNLDEFRSEDAARHPMTDLLQIVLARTRVDFREYKPTTIQRRVERRMTALGITGQAEYAQHCRAHPREVDALFRDLLISVTRFFRDPSEFASLRPLLKDLTAAAGDRPLRVWIAGCATGEEAYSIAMVLAEELGGIDAINRDRLQIFATDIDKDALEVGRKGRYAAAALDDIPDEYVQRYFTRVDDTICVHPKLQDVVLFSDHNICSDPPFLHMDLICCRNLLIYFGVSLQMKVLSRLNYALSSEGYLFLGTAETVSVSEELFKAVSRETHIYRRRVGARVENRALFSGSLRQTATDRARAMSERKGEHDAQFNRALFDRLAQSMGPDALLFSDDNRIVRVYGDVSRYLTLTQESKLTFNHTVLRPPLSHEVRTLTAMALRKNERRVGRTIRLSGTNLEVRMEAFPLKDPALDEGFTLITFRHDEASDAVQPPKASDDAAGDSARAEELQHEVRSLREELQQTVEELETSNEELQASNEELQSINEELQATNEELETSNEELQSTNEELVTVNEELHVSAAELGTVADELVAVLSSVPAPMLIIDPAMQITKANELAAERFRLRAPVDRPHVSQCYTPEGYPSLAELCSESLLLGRTVSNRAVSRGEIIEIACAPFYNDEGHVRGATVIFKSISLDQVADAT